MSDNTKIGASHLSRAAYVYLRQSSPAQVEQIVDHFGYSAGFLAAGAAASVALTVFALWMPETAEPETGRHDDRTQAAQLFKVAPRPRSGAG